MRTTVPSIFSTSVAGTPQSSPRASTAITAGTGRPALFACWRVTPSRTARSGSLFTHFSSVNRRSTTWRRAVASCSSTSSRRDEVPPRIGDAATTRAPVVRSIHRRTFSESTSRPPENDLPERLVGLHQRVGLSHAVERHDVIDHRLETARLEERDNSRRKLARQFDLLLQSPGA